MSFAAPPLAKPTESPCRAVAPARSGQLKRLAAVVEDDFSALQAIGTVVHFARNMRIFSDGDDADYSYRVANGTVRLCKVMPNGRRHIAEFLISGDFFGFEWCPTYSLTAEALTDVSAVRYLRSRLDRLAGERIEVQRGLIAAISRDLWAAQNHLVMLGCQTATERVVAFLLALAKRRGAENGDALEIPMTRQDIADYLGLTIETVCRVISALKRAHLISVPRRTQIVVHDLWRLYEIAEGEREW